MCGGRHGRRCCAAGVIRGSPLTCRPLAAASCMPQQQGSGSSSFSGVHARSLPASKAACRPAAMSTWLRVAAPLQTQGPARPGGSRRRSWLLLLASFHTAGGSNAAEAQQANRGPKGAPARPMPCPMPPAWHPWAVTKWMDRHGMVLLKHEMGVEIWVLGTCVNLRSIWAALHCCLP